MSKGIIIGIVVSIVLIIVAIVVAIKIVKTAEKKQKQKFYGYTDDDFKF